jgi:superoxide dismutase, Fe-Mn family
MPAERAPMRKVREVLRLKHALGASERQIAVSVGVSRSTIGEYLRRAAVIGITWPVPAELDDAELERRLFTPAALDGHPNAPGFVINGLKREELIAMNSMILHELFFDGLEDQSGPGRGLAGALARDFGSFERWRAEFVAMSKALGGGSGWVLLAWSPRDRKLVNQWALDHCHTLAGGTPILALDMYEHSYHIDFGAKAATYVDTFMEAIRWANADRLFDEISSA